MTFEDLSMPFCTGGFCLGKFDKFDHNMLRPRDECLLTCQQRAWEGRLADQATA